MEYGFKVASYDKTKDLVIDPLLASTFLGGSSFDEANSISIDPKGNVYVIGWTRSSDFPTTTGAYITTNSGNDDVFISKLNGNLTKVHISTYLGGSGYDFGESIAIDSSGNVYVVGYTDSSDFPTTTDAYDTSYNGGSGAFVSKLNEDLTSLLSSTYLGGHNFDYGDISLAIDSNENIYVAGYTYSEDFPTTTGAYDTSYNGNGDVFLSKLSGDLTNLLASTYLGGNDDESCSSIVIDSSGNIYLTGYTGSTDFPITTNSYDTYYDNNGDVFVSKLNEDLTTLLASTYLGGFKYDGGDSITIDSNGNVYVAGETISKKFPTTTGAYDTSFNDGYYDLFVSKLSKDLTTLLASTYLGKDNHDYFGNHINLDPVGNIYVTSTANDNSYYGYYGYPSDIFIAKLDGNLTSLLASTYFGGSYTTDFGRSMAIDSSENIYVVGSTDSSDWPTTSDVYDTSFNGGGQDAFVSKFDSDLSYLPNKGKIYGFVIDTKENPIKSVRLKLKGEKTKISKINSSITDGFFEFANLDADTYVITAKKRGYNTGKKRIRLKDGQEKEVDIEIKKVTKGI